MSDSKSRKPGEKEGKKQLNDPTESEKHSKRRKAVKSILIGSGMIAGTKLTPKEWAKPVVDSILLPAHAQTSPTAGP